MNLYYRTMEQPGCDPSLLLLTSSSLSRIPSLLQSTHCQMPREEEAFPSRIAALAPNTYGRNGLSHSYLFGQTLGNNQLDSLMGIAIGNLRPPKLKVMELSIHSFFSVPSLLLKDSSLKILAKQTQAVADNRAYVARCSSGAFLPVSPSPAAVTQQVCTGTDTSIISQEHRQNFVLSSSLACNPPT